MDESYTNLLAQAGIEEGSGQGIDAYCASRGWMAIKSSFTDHAYSRDLLCVTIFPVRADDPTRADTSTEGLSRACVLPEDDTKAAGDQAITLAARTALAQAIRSEA